MPNELPKRTVQFGAFEVRLDTGELRKSGIRISASFAVAELRRQISSEVKMTTKTPITISACAWVRR